MKPHICGQFHHPHHRETHHPEGNPPFSNNDIPPNLFGATEKLIGNNGHDGNLEEITEKTTLLPLGMENFLFPLLLTWRKSRKIQNSKGEFQ